MTMITPQQALVRLIEQREIFYDEMLWPCSCGGRRRYRIAIRRWPAVIPPVSVTIADDAGPAN